MKKMEFTSARVFRRGEHVAAPDRPGCYCCDYAGEACQGRD